MRSSENESTMHRKMAAAMGSAPSSGKSALRALRLALARAAQDIFELPLTVIGATQARESTVTVSTRLNDDNLLVVLDGPDRKIGALSVNRSYLAALIQQQTIGTVTGSEPAERPYTSTDAALIAPLVDEMLKRTSGLAEKPADADCFAGFRFGARAADTRALLLLLEAERFRIFELTVEFCGGVAQGDILLILPEPEPPAKVEGAGRKPLSMEHAVGTARADLNAVICRFKLPLHELSALRVGDTLPLVEPSLSHADLVAISGHKVTSARLGQAGGLRAVRINENLPTPGSDADQHRDFQPEALGSPKSIDDMMMLDMPAAGDLPALTETSDAPWAEGLSAEFSDVQGFGSETVDVDNFAGMEGLDDQSLPMMNVEDAAQEISELAGLTMEDADIDGDR